MRDPEKFDDFYKDARERLLVQTFALTGDLAASRRAVRDAFVVAWHHWRKLSLLDDPESVVRPHAWRLAQRRHTARVWHRDKNIGTEVKATLDALGKLSVSQRRTMILTQLAAVSMPQMAREVGVTLEVAQNELQHAATQLSLQLDLPASALRPRFDDVSASLVDAVRWPRPSIIRRAGAARRRTHTGVGVAVAVTALVVSGSLLVDSAGARPTLDRPAFTEGTAVLPDPDTDTDAAAGVTDPPPPTLTETSMLGAADLKARFDGRWSILDTSGNDEGTGLVLPCQLERYADPRGAAALVRTFTTATGKKKRAQTDAVQATQLTEASSSTNRAKRAFRTASTWFGDCTQGRVQLLATATPKKVGDQSLQIVLESWGNPQRSHVISLARTGVYTTTTVVSSPLGDNDGAAARTAAGRLLSGAVQKLCSLPDAGACGTKKAGVVLRDPLPAGATPSMLSEIDLPQIGSIKKPWVGTEPRKPVTNDAASSCDTTSFRGKFRDRAFTNNATRTFVIPGAKLPTEFGLTQTVGSLPGGRAEALVEAVRGALGGCDALNTEVDRVMGADVRDTSLSVWRLAVEVTDSRTVIFYMAIMRNGTAVSQLGFLPSSSGDLTSPEFVALAQRAQDRLAQLPKPGKG
ncbi:hypothetical protein [Nocardioides sp.]|uniref:hypothetical protein n=1 Tax=Nocardioides sp. TaxID=35761 RepID=UPI002B276726|nr:hypothetical protein [Nocardioides sp.]